MARNFDGTTGNYINLGDIADARFEQLEPWTILAFIKPTNVGTGDEKVIVGKWSGGSNTTNQFRVMVDKQSEPADLQVSIAAGGIVSGSGVIYDDTWYLIAVTHDGTSGSNGTTAYVYEMDGSQADTFTLTHVGDNSDLTHNINIASRKNGNNEPFDGDIAHVAYIKQELSANEITSYLHNPVVLVASYGSADTVFYIPLDGLAGDTGTEPDYSGNKNSGTVNGSASTQASNPPVRRAVKLLDAGFTVPAADTGISVDLNVVTAVSAPQALTVQAGEATVNLNPATAVASGQDTTIQPGAATVNLSEVTGIATPQAITITVGASVTINPANLAGSTQMLATQVGATSVDLNEATADTNGQALAVQPGEATVNLNSETAVSSPQAVSITTGQTVSLTEVFLAASPQALAVVIGTVTVALSEASFAASPQQTAVSLGVVAVNLSPASAAATPQVITASNGKQVTLVPITLSASPQVTTQTIGNATVDLDAATAKVLAFALPSVSANGTYSPVDYVATQTSPPETRIDFEWAYASAAEDGRLLEDANMHLPAYHIGNVMPSGDEHGATYTKSRGFTQLASDQLKARWNTAGMTILLRIKPETPDTTTTLFDFNLNGGSGDAYPRLLGQIDSSRRLTLTFHVSASVTQQTSTLNLSLATDWITVAVGFINGGTSYEHYVVKDPTADVEYDGSWSHASAWATQVVDVAKLSSGSDLAGYVGDMRDLTIIWDSVTAAELVNLVDNVYMVDNVTAAGLAVELGHSNYSLWQFGQSLPQSITTNAVYGALQPYRVHDYPVGWHFTVGDSYGRLFDGSLGDFDKVLGTEGTIFLRFKFADDRATDRTLLYLCDGSTVEIHLYTEDTDGTGHVHANVTYGDTTWSERITTDYSFKWVAIILRWGADGNKFNILRHGHTHVFEHGGDGSEAAGSVPANVWGYLAAKRHNNGVTTEPLNCVVSHFGLIDKRLVDYDEEAALNRLYFGKLSPDQMAAHARGGYHLAYDFTGGQQNRVLYDDGFHHQPLEHNQHVVLGTNGAYYKRTQSSPVVAGGQTHFPLDGMTSEAGFKRIAHISVRARVGKSGWSSFAGYFYFVRIRATDGGNQSGELAIRYNGNTQQLEFIYSGGTGVNQQDRSFAMDILTTEWFVASIDGRYFHVNGLEAYFEGVSVGTDSNVSESWSGAYDEATCYIGDNGASDFSCWISDVVIADNNTGSGIDRLTARLHSQALDDADLRGHFSTSKRYHWWSLTTDYLRYEVDHLEIDRSADAGISWEQVIRHWPIGQRKYTDGGLVPGKVYDYRILVAGNQKGKSDPLGSTVSTTGVTPVLKWVHSELSIVATEKPLNAQIHEDWTAFVLSGSLSHNQHGYESATLAVALPLYQAVAWKARRGGFLRIFDNTSSRLWEGRFEVISVEAETLRVSCFGLWRSLSDTPYTALWADYSSGLWYTLTTEDLPAAAQANIISGIFVTDQNNRLNMELQTATEYPANARYLWGYQVPHRSANNIKRFEFSYTITAAAGWQLAVQGVNNDGEDTWDVAATLWTLDGNGTTQTGSVTLGETELGASGYPRIIVAFIRTGATYTYNGDNGGEYAKVTNLKIKGADTATIDRGAIVRSIATEVYNLSPTWFSPVTTLIDDTGSDLQTDAIYEDVSASELVAALLTSEGDAGLVAQVKDDGVLRFGQNDDAKTWYVDVADMSLADDLADYADQHYGQYTNPAGGIARTETAVSTAGQLERNGLSRREAVIVPTTSLSFAEQARDTAVADKEFGLTRARLVIHRIEGSDGAYYPVYQLRGRDTVVVRSVPPFLGDDNSRFEVGRAEFNLVTGILTVESLEPLPLLQALLAQANS